ncbi:MAG: hypothetical protein ACLKAK_08950 [Alkaliphilus sp.]
MKSIVKIIMTVVIFSLIFTGCSNMQNSEIDNLKQTIDSLETEINLMNNKFTELERIQKRVEMIERDLHELNEKYDLLEENIRNNTYHGDLIDLTTYESMVFYKFREGYDTELLRGLKPLSIMKMFLYAGLIGDCETEYEFYTTSAEYILWTKEEYMAIPDEHRTSDFSVFKDVYDLEVNIRNNNGKYATVTWKSKNGYIDEKQGAFTYSFSLQMDGEIWKVSFLPKQ